MVHALLPVSSGRGLGRSTPPPSSGCRFLDPSAFMIQNADFQPVVDPINPATRIDDLGTVRRDLKIGDRFHVEISVYGELLQAMVLCRGVPRH